MPDSYDNILQESDQISALESAIRKYETDGYSGRDLDNVRRALTTALCATCGITEDSDQIERVISHLQQAPTGQRNAAILLLRALAVDGLLPIDDSANKMTRLLPAFLEQHLPDIAKYCKTSEKRQTFEKLNALQQFHGVVLSSFEILSTLPQDLREIQTLEAEIKRPFSNKLYQAYLQPYGFAALKAKVEAIVSQISRLVACEDARYKVFFDQLSEDVRFLKETCLSTYSFLTQGSILPFVKTVESAIAALESSASEMFKCSIIPKRKGTKIAEKKYPLHEVERSVTFKIPMENVGPGVAVDVAVEIDCGRSNSNVIIENQEQRLGDIPPGEFAILVTAFIVEPADVVRFTVEVDWRQLFGSETANVFNVEIEAQDPSVDWSELESLEPYSLEVAEGESFVGRFAKLKSIGNRLTKRQMASTYITGQKRIGKTSLARAAVDFASSNFDMGGFHSLYLEYGEYCTASPETTIRALGENIFQFLRGYIPAGFLVETPDFAGSISPLNSIAKLLSTHVPNDRFVIILDEFDEIHPEMYRLGALAETFFANLRTLASRTNLAFILVGGEKMPFIIGAQGDQLNKFVREPLDYFSRSTEWEEYSKLVVRPVAGMLNWDEAAINELYTITNGHPYYTNLLCSKILAIAVKERDTEIITSDVRHALNNLVSELDTNSFAHLWKDGINAEREVAEVTELKRLRMLVAVGRAFRLNGRKATDILAQLPAVRLQDHEGTPLLDDFIRRDIIREKNGQLHCSVFLFEKWLIEVGVNRLITSTLADDLEVELQRADDAAFVSSGEIQSLADGWPLYRSQKIGSENVRAWLEQVDSVQEQRLLFTILQNIRFPNPVEIEQKLETAHTRFVLPKVGALQIEKRSDKRHDVWVTFLGGAGKSGAQYARAYAKANSISTECIIDPTAVERKLREAGNVVKPKALLVIDDVVGSGKTMAAGLVDLADKCGPLLMNMSIPILVVALVAAEEGERRIRTAIKSHKFCPAELYICEQLATSMFAFPTDGIGFWSSQEERDRAKALCIRLGSPLYKDPLGYSGQGLLLVMPDTCPNNSLPILHKTKELSNSLWRALFPRPTT